MTNITSAAALAPDSIFKALDELDGEQLVYHFTTGRGKNKEVDLELIVDGEDVGVTITLKPDGTWNATGFVYLGEKQE